MPVPIRTSVLPLSTAELKVAGIDGALVKPDGVAVDEVECAHTIVVERNGFGGGAGKRMALGVLDLVHRLVHVSHARHARARVCRVLVAGP